MSEPAIPDLLGNLAKSWGVDLPARSEPAVPDAEMRSAYDICTSCKGHGLQDGMNGPVACDQCHGDCTVRVRDEHGRFATRPLVFDPKTGGWS